ncbi:hypothetical protein [Vagococcus xieshaowenii]|uniref:Uncharacterized protein n=1 Tax=Vagococcus xieshaowenii TaxID=2562451 RepID=A0AAJ5EFQ2_9ENTE|nr:hypothetical protein [Vagococcus xieshaowenii]QCA29111.1 hypothetical protein E4Z98_07210 [Vagococcus xieshaowenii]TFZ40913.1 hypothetical protein E4031_05885 [Vagococcus xieshaowenii]
MVDDKKLIQEKVITRFQQLFNDKDYAKAMTYLESRKEYLGDKFEEMIQWFITNRMMRISQDSKLEGNSLFKDVLGLISTNDFKKANSLVDTSKNLLGDYYYEMKDLLSFARNQALKLVLPENDHGILEDIQKLVSTNRFAEANILVDGYKEKLGDFYDDIKGWLAFGKENKDVPAFGLKTTLNKVTDTVSDAFSVTDKAVDKVVDKLTDNTSRLDFDMDKVKNLFINIGKPDLVNKLASLLKDKKYNEATLLVDRHSKDFGDYSNDVKAFINKVKLTPNVDLEWNKLIPTLGIKSTMDKVGDAVSAATDINLDFDTVKNLFTNIGKPDLANKLAGLLKDKKYNEASLLVDRHEKDFGSYAKDIRGLINKFKLTPNLNFDWAKLLPALSLGLPKVGLVDRDVKKDIKVEPKVEKVGLKTDIKDEKPDIVRLTAEEKPKKSLWGSWLPWLLGLGALGLLGGLLGLFSPKDDEVAINTDASTSETIVAEESTSKKVVVEESSEDSEVAVNSLLDPAKITSVFPSIELGGKVKIQDFATKFADGTDLGDIDLTKEYTVEKVEEKEDGDAKRSYYLTELKQWISEKDLFPELPTVDVDPISIASKFPAVAKGAKVKLQDFATKFTDGLTIPKVELGKDFTIAGVKEVVDGDSTRAYYLEEARQWISEHNLFAKDAINDKLKEATFAIGQTVKVAEHATHYEERNEIPADVKGKEYEVEDIHIINIDDSNIAYKLKGLDYWVIQQDIIK